MGWDEYTGLSDAYDWASFTLVNGASDYDLVANQANLFKNLKQTRGIIIISDQAFSIKLNSTGYPAILVTVAQTPWEFLNYKIIKNAFLSNSSGSNATVEVLLV